MDFAGVVESVGKSVTKFKPGDEVFGGRDGAFSEYVRVRESRNIVMKPANISFEEAAAVPIAAITALQAVRDSGKLKAGEKVLVNGASGGVGTFAVQIAKAMGAEVTGVCSGRNVELVRSLGADHVIDYTRKTSPRARRNTTSSSTTSSRIHSPTTAACSTMPAGSSSLDPTTTANTWGPWPMCSRRPQYDPVVSQEFGFMMSAMKPEDLTTLAGHAGGGEDPSVIDRTYKFSEVPEAIRYVETGRARGKVVVKFE